MYADRIKNQPLDITMTPLKRTRAKRSCDFCRKRKARCDADHTVPCSNCKAWGFNCEFLTVRKKRGPPSVYVENLEIRCKKMESLLTSLTNTSIKDIEKNDFRVGSCTIDKRHIKDDVDQDLCNQNEERYDDEDYDSSPDDDSTESCFDHHVYDMDRTLANLDVNDYDSIKYTGNSAGLQLFDQGQFKSKSYLQWPGREDVALKLMSQNELLVVRSDRSVSGKKKPDTRLDVGFSLRSSIFDDEKDYPVPISNPLALPPEGLIQKAYHLYFSHIHTFLPIVNRTRFEFSNGQPSNILSQAILAVAFRFGSRHFPKLFNKKAASYANVYFKKVMLKLQDAHNRARLCQVQAAVLMTLYLDMDETDVESIQWFTLGKAIRMAQDIGLHRSCSNWNLPASEIETRHRVFYACYILDRFMGARAGKPLTILDRDFDTELPVTHEVYDDDNQPGPSVYHSFVSLIELSEILGRILKALYAPKSKHSNSNAGLDDPTILAVFDRRLKNWKASMDQPAQTSINWTQAQKVNLLLFYYTTMLLLHRPFIEYSQKPKNSSIAIEGSIDLDSLAAESYQACENAASNIAVIIRQKQSLMSDPESYAPLCLPTCFVYSMFQASLIHLAVVTRNRDSLRRLRLLQRSIALLKQHEQLASARRAHNILVMLVAINGININNLLDNESSKDEDLNLSLNDDQFNPTSPMPKESEIRFSREQQPSSMHSIIQGCEDTMPKSTWYQRMMNPSIIGGITSDLHQNNDENESSSRQLNQLLPLGNHDLNNQGSTVYHHHPPIHNQPSFYELPVESSKYRPMEQQQMLFEDTPNQHHQDTLLQNGSQTDTGDYGINPNHAAAPSLLSHQHLPVQRTPFHSALPSSSTFSHMPFNNSSSPETTSSLSYSNYVASSLPQSLSWNGWGVYMGQHPTGLPLTHLTSTAATDHQSEPSPENAHLPSHR